MANGSGVSKKSRSLLREGDRSEPAEPFALIDAEKAMFGVSRCARLLGVARSGYYKWVKARDAGPGPRAQRRAELTVAVKAAHEESDGVDGAPRILATLRRQGETVSRKTVAKIMVDNGIEGISPRTWRPPTTIVDDRAHTLPDLVGRRFDQGALNKVWTSDITYLGTDEGWLYLCAVRDGCSRRVLGYAFAETLHTDVVEAALRRAHLFRDPATGPMERVIFHADRGCQYTSAQMFSVAEELNVRQSVGRTGVCWDNAQQESFWSTLKSEFYHRWHFATHAEAIHAVANWIENVYNWRRLHSSLGYLSPVDFETLMINQAEQAA
ncbi:IS3 family transposase [Mycolicibacterium brumae]|uniref:IS3 family transposase n=1 Tax=Mycolicibacterium brumae TaxID=85968 RepID=UPI000D68EF7A|nr:IS3 family transposase [Mycolicibacterium brumae]